VLPERLTLWKQEVGIPVFIDVRCIAAAKLDPWSRDIY
jgi:hypothetical protein